MKPITVIARFEARPGKENDLSKALVSLLAPTRKETGCLNYDLHISPEQPGKFLFHENWTDRKALDAHMNSPHVAALLPRVDDLCVAFPEITFWERVD